MVNTDNSRNPFINKQISDIFVERNPQAMMQRKQNRQVMFNRYYLQYSLHNEFNL